MKHSTLVAISILVAAPLIMGGCAPAVTPHDPGPALWTLHGSIAGTNLEPRSGELRVALLWLHHLPHMEMEDETTTFPEYVAEDLPVEPELPAAFSVDIHRAPPEQVIMDGAEVNVDLEGRRAAVGILAVYEDGNGNGQLDLTGPEALEFEDTVLGSSMNVFDSSSPDVHLIFLEGTEPAEAYGVPIDPGLNLIVDDGDEINQVPIETPIDIALDDHLFTRILGCDAAVGLEFQQPSEVVVVDPEDLPAGLDSDDVMVFCFELGRSLGWTAFSWIQEDERVCSTVTTLLQNYGSEIAPGESVPSGWPCPLEE